MKKRYGLGEMFVAEGLITKSQLEKALAHHRDNGLKIGESLVQLGMISEDIMVRILSKQLRVPIMRLKDVKVDSGAISMLSDKFVNEFSCFPFGRGEGTLKVIVKDPLNLILEDEILSRTGLHPEFYIGLTSEINKLINDYYVHGSVVSDLENIIDDTEDDFFDIGIDNENSPIIKITNSIFKGAVTEGASDIHIGVTEHKMDVRYRIDGILHKVQELPKNAHAALVSRIKTMSDMDITDRRKAQDGRIQINLDGASVDMRVSTIPSVHGEKVTIRILDKSNLLLNLNELGLQEEVQKRFKNLIQYPVGVVLITGPTGSGKSSTLYTVVNELNDVSKNIVTIEDPVEYKIDGIVQVQVNPKAGLTFADGLRSILRQDPDIILVGEIRDRETADIAVRASNTGHLVFATLHTNDAVSSVTRLVDMGVEPYLVAGSVMGVMNQRLVRRICLNCKESYTSKGFSTTRKFFGIPDEEELTLFRGLGCDECNQTGYRGRVSIQELLVMTPDIQRLISDKASEADILSSALESGMHTLKQDGIDKSLEGITTLEEVQRFVLE